MSTPTLTHQPHHHNSTLRAEASWDEVFSSTLPENPARTAFREAVMDVAERAQAALPQSEGRIASALKIVLQGDVDPQPDGTAKVTSQSNGTTRYFVVNGACDCPDAKKAPEGFCKHRLAHGIYKRAKALANQKLQALDTPAATTPELPPASPPVPPMPLPEAPASINVYIDLGGRKAQLTLRDTDEQRLLQRMAAVLAQFPLPEEHAPAPEAPEMPEGWCRRHDVQMKQNSNAKGAWWSHRLDDGSWCKGK